MARKLIRSWILNTINSIFPETLWSDGDQPTKEPKDDEKVKEVKKVAKEVKDIQAMVRNFTLQAQELLPSSSGFHPVFVHLLTQAPLGMIECILAYPQV